MVLSAGNAGKTIKVKEFIEHGYDHLDIRGWDYAVIDGEAYIIRIYHSGENRVYYGAILSMGSFLEEFQSHVEYECLECAVTGREEGQKMPEGVIVTAYSQRAPGLSSKMTNPRSGDRRRSPV